MGCFSLVVLVVACRRKRARSLWISCTTYGDAGPLAGTWDEAKGMYKQVLRDPENINYITIFREPREHLLSYYTFFIEPKTRVSRYVL